MDESINPDKGSIAPALVATGIWMGVGAALDVYLVVKNKPYLITHVLRTKFGKFFLVVLFLHVMDVLGKADPFRVALNVIKTTVSDPVRVPVSLFTTSLSDFPTGK